MTLREVCDAVGVSRRAVQGYEKAGLVRATGKTSRGYLLYDEGAQQQIKKIKLFQELGFTLKEIGALSRATDEELKAALERQVEKLKQESGRVGEMIRVAQEMIERL